MMNKARCELPNGFNHKLTDWSLSDWLTAIAGELGEAANIIKKLNRIRDNIPGNKESDTELNEKLLGELADVVIYADLFFQRLDTSLEFQIKKKFNEKSKELGFPYYVE